jgi:HNH endonuclease
MSAFGRTFHPDSDVEPIRVTGRYILDGGYVVLVRPDHPLADPKGTVFEHRLVLYNAGIDPTGYDVRHLNGDRGDNRIENLQLVERSEPAAGQNGDPSAR